MKMFNKKARQAGASWFTIQQACERFGNNAVHQAVFDAVFQNYRNVVTEEREKLLKTALEEAIADGRGNPDGTVTIDIPYPTFMREINLKAIENSKHFFEDDGEQK